MALVRQSNGSDWSLNDTVIRPTYNTEKELFYHHRSRFLIPFKSSAYTLAKRLKQIFGVDRAIGLTILGRCFTLPAGVVTIMLISRLMSPIEQGYYYSIWSLWALQTVFELGFSFVILQVAAHERASLSIRADGVLQGDIRSISRLAGLLRTVQRWYLVAALIMVTILLVWGFRFFNMRPSVGVHWQWPWILTVLAAGLMFQIGPTISFLEGCGYVSDVAGQRLIQSVASYLVGWIAIISRHGLYAPGCMVAAECVTGFAFFYRHRRLLLQLLRERSIGYDISWRNEILPFQWRVALTWLTAYIPNILFAPLLFSIRGPVEAGKMGLSMNIALSLGFISLSWMTTKAAPFGSLVARGQELELDRLFFRTLRQSFVLVGIGAAAIFFGAQIIDWYLPSIGNRMLPQAAFFFLLLTTVCNHLVQSESLYMRSHKQEPFMYQSLAIALLLAACSWFGAKSAGSLGLAMAYFICSGVIASVSGTIIFRRKRRVWLSGYEVQT